MEKILKWSPIGLDGARLGIFAYTDNIWARLLHLQVDKLKSTNAYENHLQRYARKKPLFTFTEHPLKQRIALLNATKPTHECPLDLA